MSADDRIITVSLQQQADFAFDIDFGDGIALLRGDEPPPLGRGSGPSPVQLLTAAVANCLSDSLLFALRKYKQSPDPITTVGRARVGRNAEGRLRVLDIAVDLTLGVPASTLQHLDRVLASFEAFCTVTQSVGQGIAVRARIIDSEGTVLTPDPAGA